MADNTRKEEVELLSETNQIDNSYIEQIVNIFSAQKNISNDKFRSISNLIEIIKDKKNRSLLLEILNQIQILSTETYSTSNHITLIKLFDNLISNETGYLHEELIEKFQRVLNKEIRFLKMSSDSIDFHNRCDLFKANFDNLTPKNKKPDQQGFYLSYVVVVLLDYRLATLSDNQAWNFLAQSLLEDL